MQPILITLGISLLIQAIFFAFAATFKSDKVTDLSYSLTFIIIAIYWLLIEGTFDTGRLVLATMITIWGMRLGSYLFIRILKIGKDARFDGIRENFWSFAKFWLLQGVSVWIIVLPAAYYLSLDTTTQVDVIAYIGIAVWAVGLITETIADIQKFKYYDIPKDERPKPWIDYGVWKHSRHPNYFGEMLVWWGIFIFVIPALSGIGWLTVVGPIWITILLLFVTGIPTLEKKMDKEFADNPDYQQYKETTPLLVPFLK